MKGEECNLQPEGSREDMHPSQRMEGRELGAHRFLYSGISLSVLYTFPLVQSFSNPVLSTFGAK